MAEPYHLKTTFKTKWGTFSFKRMPFRLIKVSATFQREMDITFCGLIGQSVLVYLNDVTIFSKRRSNHVCHLKQIFERCCKYEIFLNPKKSIFVVLKCTLLGHIIAKSGIKVDLERVKTIAQILFHVKKKAMQSFLGKIRRKGR